MESNQPAHKSGKWTSSLFLASSIPYYTVFEATLQFHLLGGDQSGGGGRPAVRKFHGVLTIG